MGDLVRGRPCLDIRRSAYARPRSVSAVIPDRSRQRTGRPRRVGANSVAVWKRTLATARLRAEPLRGVRMMIRCEPSFQRRLELKDANALEGPTRRLVFFILGLCFLADRVSSVDAEHCLMTDLSGQKRTLRKSAGAKGVDSQPPCWRGFQRLALAGPKTFGGIAQLVERVVCKKIC